MSWFTLFLLAVALGADAFSLSIGIGMIGVRTRQIIVLSITVLLFHVIMPLIGFGVGEMFVGLGKIANILGGTVLIVLGLKMIKEAIWGEKEEETEFVIANTLGLVLLAGSVSLDALSVGFTLGTQKVDIILAVSVIGLIAGLMTAIGLIFGRIIGKFVGNKAEILGGLVLIVIGIKLFF